MKHTVPHDLEQERAKEMVDKLIETYGEHYKDYDLSANWKDDQTAEVAMCVQGKDVKGTIKIAPDCFDLDFDMPWMFRPFGGMIRRTVDDEVERWIANYR